MEHLKITILYYHIYFGSNNKKKKKKKKKKFNIHSFNSQKNESTIIMKYVNNKDRLQIFQNNLSRYLCKQ